MTAPDWADSSESIVVATPMADASAVPQSVRGVPGAAKETDGERAANRLRKAGYSYRRIAETLKIPYITVSRWLSGDLPFHRKPPPPPPPPIKADPRDLVVPEPPTADAASDAAPDIDEAPVAPMPPRRAVPTVADAPAVRAPSPERGAEDDDIGHRLEVLQLQFSAFEGYARNMAEEFGRNRKELLDTQAKAVEDMTRERDAITLARKGFDTAILRFDNRFDELAAELRQELATLKDEVRGELADLREKLEGLGQGGGARRDAGAKPTAAAEDDDNPFGDVGDDEEDPFASVGKDEDDPFGDVGDDEDGDDDNPFGDVDDDEEDPFASVGTDEDDPFSDVSDKPAAKAAAPAAEDDEDDPFGDVEAAGDNPFGDADEDPFGDLDNPFGDVTEPAADKPAAQADAPATKAGGDDDDPFGDVDLDNPFGGADDDPFGGSDNPFGSADTPRGGSNDRLREAH